MKTCNGGIFAIVLALSFPVSAKNMNVPKNLPTAVPIRANQPFCFSRSNRPNPRNLIKTSAPKDFKGKSWSRQPLSPKSTASGGGQTLLLDPPEVVEVTSDITINTIWQKTKIYRVTGTINVQALLVIEPGTTIKIQPQLNGQGQPVEGEEGGLDVKLGGTLIAAGTPDERITFTSVDEYPWPGSYYHAILFEETASSSSRVAYCFFEFPTWAIETQNLRLDDAIRNNYFLYAYVGVIETGILLTDVVNNLIAGSQDHGIYIDQVSGTLQESSISEVLVQNNTVDSPYNCGILFYGAYQEANKGKIRIFNNIFSNAYYAVVWGDGAIYLYLVHNGYYGNYSNRNIQYDEPGDIEMPSGAPTPYDTGSGLLGQYHLKSDSVLINAGCGGIEFNPSNPNEFVVTEGDITLFPPLVGSTVLANRNCDTGTVDMGFHYSNFDLSNSGAFGDLNKDGIVDASDKAIIQSHYGTQGTYEQGDLNGDGIIDSYDLRILRKNWGVTGVNQPYIQPTILGDLNNLQDVVEVGCSGDKESFSQIFVSLDGNIVDAIGDINGDTFYNKAHFKSSYFLNGPHQIKLIGITTDGSIVLSPVQNVTFANELYGIVLKNIITPGQDLKIQGFYSGSETLQIRVLGLDDSILYGPQTISAGTSVNISVPSSPCTADIATKLHINPLTNEEKKLVNEFLAKKFERNNGDYRFLISIPEQIDLNKNTGLGHILLNIRSACANKNMLDKVCILYKENCTWDNLKYVLQNKKTINNMYRSTVRYWFHHSHAGLKDSRTYICVYKKNWFSSTVRDPIYAFTKKDQDDHKEDTLFQGKPCPTEGNSLYSLGLKPSNGYFLKIVFFDGCWTSFDDPDVPEKGMVVPLKHDMAYSLGQYQEGYAPPEIYFGWRDGRHDSILANAPDGIIETSFITSFWYGMGYLNVYNALQYAKNSVDQRNYMIYNVPQDEYDLWRFIPRGNAQDGKHQPSLQQAIILEREDIP